VAFWEPKAFKGKVFQDGGLKKVLDPEHEKVSPEAYTAIMRLELVRGLIYHMWKRGDREIG
jgi:hypothetical protein